MDGASGGHPTSWTPEDRERITEALRRVVRGEVRVDEPMARHTSWRVGGPVDCYVIPADRDDLVAAVGLARELDLPVYVLGHGTNVLVRDDGLRGMVVATQRALDYAAIEETNVRAGAGVSLPTLARRVAAQGLAGLEFGVGIPGTLGGALVMNAGAGEGDMSRVVQWVEVLDRDGPRRLGLEELGYGYRRSALQGRRMPILEAGLRLWRDDPAAIAVRMQRHLDHRARTQPIGTANAGSVFKNPRRDYAGRLLEAAGAKGLAVGDAQVSQEHANFIVNRGRATAGDVLALIELLRERVRERFGVRLELEVEVLGGPAG